MAKKVLTLIKLQVPAGAANPAPPVGPALGQHGVNIMEFCKAFNAQTQDQGGTIIPVEITVFEDRSFTFITKTPPAAVLIKQAAASTRARASRTARRSARSRAPRLREIAETKMPDLNANDLDAATKIIEGTARSMGVEVAGLWLTASATGSSTPRSTASSEYAPAEAVALIKEMRRPSSTRRWRCTSAPASTSAMPTSSCAARSRFPTARASEVKIAVFAKGEKAREAEAGRRRQRRRRGAGQEGRGGLHRLRRGDRHAGHDARGRQARPRARPAGQDAEPQGRHRHRRRGQGG